jgi:hypothetical protein
MLGGYAGAFTLWNYTDDHLTRDGRVLVALLLGVSVGHLCFFEVFKMVYQSQQTLKQVRLMNQNLAPSAFLSQTEELKRNSQKGSLNTLLRVWVPVMIISVGAGLSAVGILFYNFFAILLRFPLWP